MLTQFALSNRTLVLAIMLVCMIAGPISFFTHPSREDPKIVIRNAQVFADFPGMSADRIEDLITRQIEEKIREIPEIWHIESTSSTGRAFLSVQVRDQYIDMAPIWTDLRNKMRDIQGDLPEGTQGPVVFDDQGNVAMATVAITADGFENAEIREAAKEFRRQVYALVPGVRKVELFGVEEQRIFVEFDNIRMSQLGIDPMLVVDAVQRQNVILPGGRVEADGTTITIEPTGDFADLEDLAGVAITVGSSTLYLRDLADIRFGYEDPPGSPAFYNGDPAVVVSVSMIDQFDSEVFTDALTAVVDGFEQRMPWGFKFSFITLQQTEIEGAVFSVLNNLWQTILVVLAVVIAFLGVRTGLIVGAIVPLVMLISTLVMRYTGIELERMSLASLIISLGLLVDNGIVVAEEMQNRLKRGQERAQAAVETGRALAMPLLAASLTTILAFMPLMLAPGGAGEYTRSISLVIAIALIVSWVVALTFLPLLCMWFMKTGADTEDEDAAYDRGYYHVYRGLLRNALRFRWIVMVGAVGFLYLGVWMFGFVGQTFFPASERTQLQVIVELPVNSNSNATQAVVERLEDWLLQADVNPEVVSTASYIASGGPRFYLALEPITSFPNVAYMLVNVRDSDDVIPMRERLRAFAFANVPEARISPKEMSMGPSEVGLVEYRIIGEDEVEMAEAADKIMTMLRAAPGTQSIKSDWETPTVTLQVIVDQDAARRAGVTSEDIANALNSQLTGLAVTDYRLGDVTIPIVMRSQGDQRENLDRIRTLNITRAGGAPVPLLQVASFDGVPSFSRIKRRDLRRVMTVSGKSTQMTAQALDASIWPEITELQAQRPAITDIEKGGELEGSSEAQEALFANVPIAFALMVLVLIWQFNSFRKPSVIMLTIPFAVTGVAMGLLIFPGANFSFMGILGFLALAGIVINNAIVLLDRIEIELAAGREHVDAIVEAGVRRFQPIVMTTCTTALGLAPIILSRDVLFYDLAVVIAGGLIVGTALTLFVAPCLYAIFFRVRSR